MQVTLLFVFIFVSTNIPGYGNPPILLVSGHCQTNEQALLLQIKNTLSSTPALMSYLSKWNETTDCCTWPLVGCDNVSHIISLQLNGDSYSISHSGDTLSNIFNLKHLEYLELSYLKFSNSNIPSELENLTHLKSLYLRNCGFQESIPPLISDLTQLQVLDLSFNSFTGPIPDSISNLTHLMSLNLASNRLNGSIPSSLANLTRLEFLDLSSNHFMGPLPQFHHLKSLKHLDIHNDNLLGDISSLKLELLSNLTHLDLSSNFFHGSIPPSVFQHGSFSYLDLSHNTLKGPIPDTIFHLTGLRSLSLSSNMLNGSIDLDIFERFTNLVNLDLSYNNLEVNVSRSSFTRLPSSLDTLRLSSCNLTSIPGEGRKFGVLDLSSNRISGNIPAWIWSVLEVNLSNNSLVCFEGGDIFPVRAIIIDLHSNQLHGTVPSFLYYATYVDISYNNFNSTLVPGFGISIPTSAYFSISNNKFTGAIPESFCSVADLQVLDLSSNNFSGGIPSCLLNRAYLDFLKVLNLQNNSLSGLIPDVFSDCGFQTLGLNGNLLEGSLPESLMNCQHLEVFDLGNNNFNGGFPCWLKNISGLRVLILKSNKFHGDISCIENNSWSVLQIVDLASNNFSGELPKKALTHGTAMKVNQKQSDVKRLQYLIEDVIDVPYHDRVEINMKGNKAELVNLLTIYTSMDLSSNKFQGRIPEEIGLLQSLLYLNLSRNSLTGSIPNTIVKIEPLESLDLSVNNLQGHIPTELANLNFLSVLDLSYNQLEGRIPTGSQLQLFSPISFEGNEGLCGPPLNDCSTVIPHPIRKVDHGGLIFDWKMGLFIGFGFGIGFAATVVPWVLSDRVNLWYNIFLHKLLRFFSK